MEFDPIKRYVPMPPNQNLNIVTDPQYKRECNAILQHLLQGKNTNNGIWFFENVAAQFPDIPVTALDRVIFPKLKVDGYITIINGIQAPSSTARVQFRLSDEGKVFVAKGGYAISNPKNMKDFTLELLTLLDENGATINVVDFVTDFQQTNGIDRSTVKFKMDDLVRDKLITSTGHEYLAVSGGHAHNERPFIYANITPAGQTYLASMKERKGNEHALRLLDETLNTKSTIKTTIMNDNTKVFIVHGHDELAKTEVARFVEKLGFTSIILHEQASEGKTIIEKIEAHSNVGFGIVLYTPCDVGAVETDANNLHPRARQNVVFEHGYLIGKLGRNKVCALVKDTVEKPNDISGVVFVQMDSHQAWHMKVAKEMKAAGYAVDMNKL